jgi:hypothetical protein
VAHEPVGVVVARRECADLRGLAEAVDTNLEAAALEGVNLRSAGVVPEDVVKFARALSGLRTAAERPVGRARERPDDILMGEKRHRVSIEGLIRKRVADVALLVQPRAREAHRIGDVLSAVTRIRGRGAGERQRAADAREMEKRSITLTS